MQVWRLCRKEYANLSGVGASLYGGRWNSPGHPMIYTASSLSLAFVEIIPGLRKSIIPKGFVSLLITIEENASKKELTVEDFPKYWRQEKGKRWFVKEGDQWLKEKETLLLSVPSVIVPEEKNILINPLHPDIPKVKIQSIKPFTIDSRFVG